MVHVRIHKSIALNNVNTADLFWYGPRRFTLHDGESASLQFVSVSHREE